MHANDMNLLNQTNIFPTTQGYVYQNGCWRNEKLLSASIGVK